MDNERLIEDLFESARNELPIRSIESVEQYVKGISMGTNESLVTKWLKQNKMNMLITTTGIIVTATILFSPQEEISQTNDVEQVEIQSDQEAPLEFVIVEEDSSSTQKEEIEIRETVESSPIKQVKPATETPNQTDLPVKEAHVDQRTISPQEEHAEGFKEEVVPNTVQHALILESDKGRVAADEFGEYLKVHLSSLNPEFTSNASKEEVRKFTLKLDNGYQADLRMQVAGFDKLELHWDMTDQGEIINMWYRIDAKEIKKLDFSKSQKFSIRVKHKHQEF